MANKRCQFCQNSMDDDILKDYEILCAKNPSVQERQRKLGEIEAFKKTVVLTDGKIDRMYWAHSTGAQAFDVEPVLRTWREIDSGVNPNDPTFLISRGFTIIYK